MKNELKGHECSACVDRTRWYQMFNVAHHHHSSLSSFWLVNDETLNTPQGRGETIKSNICEKRAVKRNEMFGHVHRSCAAEYGGRDGLTGRLKRKLAIVLKDQKTIRRFTA